MGHLLGRRATEPRWHTSLMAVPLAVHLLGRPFVERGGVRRPPPRGRKAWALLAYLTATESAPSRGWLAELLFADAEDPLNALSWTLSQLRRLLGPAVSIGGEQVDVRLPRGAFLDVRALTTGTWLQALNIPGLGRQLLEGMTFPSSSAFEVWLLTERRRLAGAADNVLREAARAKLAIGDTQRAIELAGRLVAANGLDEDAQELLIRAYATAGDRAAADRQRDACIALFRVELGVDPGPAVLLAAEATSGRERIKRIGTRASVAARLEAGQAAMDAGAIDGAIVALRAAVEEANDTNDADLQSNSLLALGSALVHGVRGARRRRRGDPPRGYRRGRGDRRRCGFSARTPRAGLRRAAARTLRPRTPLATARGGACHG